MGEEVSNLLLAFSLRLHNQLINFYLFHFTMVKSTDVWQMLLIKQKETSTAAVDPGHLKVVKFSSLFICYKQNLPISDVNYVNRNY